MHVHFCGNIFHDIPMAIMLVLQMSPEFVYGLWVKSKQILVKRKK